MCFWVLEMLNWRLRKDSVYSNSRCREHQLLRNNVVTRFKVNMVGIAQSVERLVVVQKVAGSNPVTHPAERPESFDSGLSFCLAS